MNRQTMDIRSLLSSPPVEEEIQPQENAGQDGEHDVPQPPVPGEESFLRPKMVIRYDKTPYNTNPLEDEPEEAANSIELEVAPDMCLEDLRSILIRSGLWSLPNLFQIPEGYAPELMIACTNSDLEASPGVDRAKSPYSCIPLPTLEPTPASNEGISPSTPFSAAGTASWGSRTEHEARHVMPMPPRVDRKRIYSRDPDDTDSGMRNARRRLDHTE